MKYQPEPRFEVDGKGIYLQLVPDFKYDNLPISDEKPVDLKTFENVRFKEPYLAVVKLHDGNGFLTPVLRHRRSGKNLILPQPDLISFFF